MCHVQLLSEARFQAIDKIKTVGSTYMAAVGLMPEHRISDQDEGSAAHYMTALVEFVFAMREKLININDNSYNNFMLRVGESEKLIFDQFFLVFTPIIENVSGLSHHAIL